MNKHQTEEYKTMLKEAIEVDGLQFALDALQEECAELITAISHLRRNRCDSVKVIEELADMVMLADMVRVGIDDEIGFYDYIKQKSEKVGDKIKFKKGGKSSYPIKSTS